MVLIRSPGSLLTVARVLTQSVCWQRMPSFDTAVIVLRYLAARPK
jgi:hypothetical protein